MNRLSPLCLWFALSGVAVQAQAETVVPLQGQSSTQIQQDIDACRSSSTSADSSTESGGRLRGAAVGAAAGAVGAEVRANQHEGYDRIDEDVQQEYRQNQARETAAAGAVVGGVRQRRDRAEDSASAGQVDSAAYTSCLQARGYQVSP